MLLGEDTLTLLVLALGAAMLVGNGLALIRPPRSTREGELERAPLTRTVVMMAVGAIAAIWALASLVR